MEVVAAGAEDGASTTENFTRNSAERLIELESLLEQDLDPCCHLNLGFEDNWCQLEPMSSAELSPADISHSLAELNCAHIPLSLELNQGDRLGSSAELIPTDKLFSTEFSHAELSHRGEPNSSAELGHADSPVSAELSCAHSPFSSTELKHTDRPISFAESGHAEIQSCSVELLCTEGQVSFVELGHVDGPIFSAELGLEDVSVTSAEQSCIDIAICPAELNHENGSTASAELTQSDRLPPPADLSHADRSVSPAELSHRDMPISSPEPIYVDRPGSSAELSHGERPHPAVELDHSGTVAPELLCTESSNESR